MRSLHYLFYRILHDLPVTWWQFDCWPLLLAFWIVGTVCLLYLAGRFIARASSLTWRRSIRLSAVILPGQFFLYLLGGWAWHLGSEVIRGPSSPFEKADVATPALAGMLLSVIGLYAFLAWRLKTPARRLLPASLLPISVQILFAWPVMMAVAMAGSSRAYELPNRTVCARNLSGFAQAITRYRAAHAGALPSDLPNLVQEEGLPRGNLICPSSRNMDPNRCYYFYFPGDANSSDKRLIMCDFGDNHPDNFRNVLRADLSVRGMDESAFARELTRPCNAPFAAALAVAEADPNSPARYCLPEPGPDPAD